MKRAFDVMAAAFGLLVAVPVLAITALFIRRESPGPAIFAQRRVGRNGVEFTCYKLRTMYTGTAQRPTHKLSSSSVTPLGGFLRRTKLDEVPQLYNVLVGDMSLVGPRPCLPAQIELIASRRAEGALDVRPGITGLAQVMNVDMSDPQRLSKIDGDYARTQSFAGDLRLILATLTGSGRGIDRTGADGNTTAPGPTG